MRKFGIVALSLALAACGAMPHHAKTRTTQTASLAFSGSPAGGSVFVDGVEVAELAGERMVVPVRDGTRHVVITWVGNTVFDRKIFIQNGTQKEVAIH